MEGKVIKKEWVGAVGNKKGEGVNYFSKVRECEQVREIHVIGGQLNIMIMYYLKRSVSVGKGFLQSSHSAWLQGSSWVFPAYGFV